MNLKELDDFKLNDAVHFHDILNPALFETDSDMMRPAVRKRLLTIAEDFIDHLGVNVKVEDITLSGSSAAYSYTKHSDIDLHILVDMSKFPDNEVYAELFHAKKTIYNETHDITIFGYDVELYVQDSNEPVVSLGEYSIKNDKWIKLPRKRRANFDQNASQHKYNKLGHLIERAIQLRNLDLLEKLVRTLKKYRKAGLDKHGEFGPENLAYKALRTQGMIQKIYDTIEELHSEKLSLPENITDEDYHPNEKPRGPEFKPTMPAGTVKVDVSDVYDWYKLGQHISNLKGLGKHDFGKGPPSTILSFGSEPEEHEYIKDLEKTGLTTTDIDPVDKKQPKGMKRQKVDPTYNVNEDIDRRSMLKAIGAVAAGVPSLAKAGPFVNVRDLALTDPKTVEQVWGPRYTELNERSQTLMKRLIAAAGPEFAPALKGTRLRIVTNENYAQASAITRQITLDLSVFWDAPDAALAFAIGHELGHIALDHASADDPDADYNTKLRLSQQSRQDELDADLFAIRVCKVLGYNRAEILKFITQNEEEYRQLEKELQSPLSTHPTHKMRIDRARMNGFQLSKGGIQQMNALKTHLAEAFEDPYHFTWEKSEFGDYDALATLADGTYLSIMFNNEGDDEWQVEFYRSNTQEITGEGDAQRVFATVLSAIHHFIQKENPWRITFSAKQEVEPGEYNPSRSKLYNRLVQRYANAWGYDEYSEDHGDQVVYELTKKKESVAEASGYIPSEKEKNDPRFKTALTVDVHPDSIKKNAKAFGFKVSRAGIPPLLRK